MSQNYFENVENILKKRGEISPFLFLSQNLEILHADIRAFILQLLSENNIDTQSLFHLEDLGEALKIGEVKVFLAQWNVRPRFAFQVFFIENISRMTLQAQNACLKFFEEPGEWNIVFLSSSSESGVLETILSRVSLIQFSSRGKHEAIGNSFYYSMIDSHVLKSSDELVRYFFSWKYERDEYVDFLTTIIYYIEKTGKFIHLLDELHEDIWWILKNNLQWRYIADKYIMLLGNHII
jgi:hypothetical protein